MTDSSVGSIAAVPEAPRRNADLALLSVALIWGINIPVMKYAHRDVHPLAFNTVRLSFSAIVLGLMVWRVASRSRPAPVSPAPASAATQGADDVRARMPWRRILVLTLLGSVFYQTLFLVGMERTTGGNTALLIASSPIWTAILARMMGIESLTRGAWSGLLLAFAGTLLVTFEGGDVELVTEHLVGNLMVLGAAVVWASTTVLMRPIVDVVSPTRIAFWTSVLSLPAHFALAAPVGEASFAAATPAVWWCAVYAGVFSTGFAYVFWNYGVRQVGPSHTAIFTNLVPVVAIAGSWAFLREALAPQQLIGGTLILAGLIVMRRGR